MAVGYFLKVVGVLDDHSINKNNGLVFKCVLPIMMFMDIINSDFISYLEPKLVVYCVAVTCSTFLLTWALADKFIKEKNCIGAFVQGACRSNYAILGLALINTIMGDHVQGKGIIVIALVIPLYNVLSIIVLSAYSNMQSEESLATSTIKNVCKNPLIIGILLGVLFSLLKIKLPMIIESSLNQLKSISTPLALLAIGGSLDFKKGTAKMKLGLIATAIKLVIIPVVFVSLAVVLGFRGEDLLVIAVMCASPAAVSSYIMAVELGSDGPLASNIILLTTSLSVVTYTLGLYYMRLAQLI